MTFKIMETGKKFEVELRVWRGGWNAGYEPDFFADVEPNLGKFYDDESECYVVSQDDFDSIVEWWKDEADRASKDSEYEGDGLCGLHKDDEDDHYELMVESKD